MDLLPRVATMFASNTLTLALQELILPNQKGYGKSETGTLVMGRFSFSMGLTVLYLHPNMIYIMTGDAAIEGWIMSHRKW